MEFYFTLKLFIDHLNISDVFETDELDLDLQGQIGLETYKFCAIPCECNNFETLRNFSFKLEMCLFETKDGQICHESLNVCTIQCECDNF